MVFHSRLKLSLSDKIEECIDAARDTEKFCKDFRADLEKIRSALVEVERQLGQTVDLFDGDPYDPVNRSYRIIQDLLIEIEDDVETIRNTTVCETR